MRCKLLVGGVMVIFFACFPCKTLCQSKNANDAPKEDAALRKLLLHLSQETDYDNVLSVLSALEGSGTLEILPEAKQAYIENAPWPLEPDALFLSYFLRTDPEFAEQLIAQHVEQRRRADRDFTIFTDIAHVRASPELGKVAAEYLDYPDKRVAANAAYIFKWVGNANVAPVLWSDLEAWHDKWMTKETPIPLDEQSYEDSLVEALLLGSGPCRSKETMDRLRPLYIKSNSVDGNIDLSEWHDPIAIFVSPTSTFEVDFCSGWLDFYQLKAAIPQFPRSTTFELHRSYKTPDLAFEPWLRELKGIVTENGMSIRLQEQR